ncbi:hypothetical protein [Barnesiella sp.]|uniref:hypothetical protein n=1 Tax=Barnesiella sp. TaxID=2033407 RepID=UPI00258A3D64|nr:hypothetical protein [Barnesiella sp.]
METVWQFCTALLEGGLDSGVDFSDLPDMDKRRNKSVVASKLYQALIFLRIPY